jgi:hypothetical protein
MDKIWVSITEFRRLPEIPDYKTEWLMAHNDRGPMASREAPYQLAGFVGLDEALAEGRECSQPPKQDSEQTRADGRSPGDLAPLIQRAQPARDGGTGIPRRTAFLSSL